MPDISKITLPGGNTYDIKDTVARESVTTVTNQVNQIISAGVSYQVVTSLPTPSEANKGIIYLVADATSESGSYVEYICVNNGTDWVNEKIGTTSADLTEYVKSASLGSLAYKDSVALDKKTDVALGEATTFTNAPSAVSFAAHTTKPVLTTSVTATVPKTSSTTKYLSGSVSDVGLSVTKTQSFLTGLGTASTDEALGTGATFTTSVTPTTTNIKATASGTALNTSASSFLTGVTPVQKKLATTSITGVSGTQNASLSNVSNGTAASWSATVSNEVLTFAWTANTPANVTDGYCTVPKAASATTVATGSLADGTGIVTGLTPASSSALTAASVKTQPTIALSTDATAGTGVISVATGITSASTTVASADKVTAVTGYASPSSTTAVTAVSVSAQPAITLSTATSTSTGAVKYIEAVSTSGTDAVTFDTTTAGKTANAITALGAGTAAAQAITVGTNDKVTVLTNTTGVTVS